MEGSPYDGFPLGSSNGVAQPTAVIGCLSGPQHATARNWCSKSCGQELKSTVRFEPIEVNRNGFISRLGGRASPLFGRNHVSFFFREPSRSDARAGQTEEDVFRSEKRKGFLRIQSSEGGQF